jgi:peptidylprolyl isomerase
LAFGSKGRPSSAGRPRIPADAIVTFEVEMVGIPGREPELIELIGDF